MAKTKRAEPAPQYLISTTLRQVSCTRCGGPILAGHVRGERVAVDPIRLNRQGELIALLATLPTYQVAAFGRAKNRAFRRIASNIAGDWPPLDYIHPAHQCGRVYNAEQFDTREMSWEKPQPEECPY
jgi:hypothetical protein